MEHKNMKPATHEGTCINSADQITRSNYAIIYNLTDSLCVHNSVVRVTFLWEVVEKTDCRGDMHMEECDATIIDVIDKY